MMRSARTAAMDHVWNCLVESFVDGDQEAATEWEEIYHLLEKMGDDAFERLTMLFVGEMIS